MLGKIKPTISFVTASHNPNEILLLKQKKLLKIFDEIIIVNTGKTHYENEIQNKINIFNKQFNADFSEIKNIAISLATSDWIFMLDTDETVDDKFIEQLKKLVSNNTFEGYWFSRRNYISKDKYLKYGVFFPDYQLRLFRRRNYRFIGLVHEMLSIPDSDTQKTSMVIHHFPTNSKYLHFKNIFNFNKYIKLLSHDLVRSRYGTIELVSLGINKFFSIFFGGFFRGKGFLDGWAGFRAHLLFGLSISLSYWLAAYKRIMRQI